MTATQLEQHVVPTAEIIAFPTRPPMPAPQETGQAQVQGQAQGHAEGHDRLVRALDALNAALAEQRSAITAWRSAMADLTTSTSGLGDSLGRYRTNLTNLGWGVSSLRAQANVLRAWAETPDPVEDE
jgi:hypothetical protein